MRYFEVLMFFWRFTSLLQKNSSTNARVLRNVCSKAELNCVREIERRSSHLSLYILDILSHGKKT